MEINISNKPLLYRRLTIGAAIAFAWTAFFLYKGGAFDPKWPSFWYLRPLILVPLAGAVGGVFYHLMEGYRNRGRWMKVGINLLCILVYIVGVWIGTVLGLAGVWWD
ncbi:MAG: hypothetical protein KBF57_09065 [Saprospiraceae bacterium]|jgi:H+/Cl- antiporter ClcA|nr:hypothetical protein [Saprospiraceae bacterium]MBP9194823.1 hypothetical protein [Saprospiraceae bacterium]